MLSGKDVYEAARPHFVKLGLGAMEWEYVPQALYDEVAKNLNAQFIIPLEKHIQKQSKTHIDSELETLHCTSVVLDDFQAQITVLKALVKDYQEFSKYATPTLKAGRLEWEAESNTLCKRAQQLLGEEAKQ